MNVSVAVRHVRNVSVGICLVVIKRCYRVTRTHWNTSAAVLARMCYHVATLARQDAVTLAL